MTRVAALTMVYNEAALLPIWMRHYGGQLGYRNCCVIDHGSDDGSTGSLGEAGVIRLPRTPLDDVARARLVSRLCSGLLGFYDAVIYTDVDELLVAEPARYVGLADYAAAMPHDVVTAIGLNVIQMAEDPPIDPAKPVSEQRRSVAFSSALCKPILTRRPIEWAPGFHCADAPLQFDALFLFHLRYHDRAASLARLARTRSMPWANLAAGAHQRVSDESFTAMLAGFAEMEPEDCALDPRHSPLADWLASVRASQVGRETQAYTIDLQLNSYRLWSLPERFVGRF